MNQLDLFAHQRRQPIATWPEGFIAFPIDPPARALAAELVRRWPEHAALSLPGTCLLVRRRYDVILDLVRHDGWPFRLQTEPWAIACDRRAHERYGPLCGERPAIGLLLQSIYRWKHGIGSG